MRTLKKTFEILSHAERKQIVLLGAFAVLAAFVQIASIASIMPFLALLANPAAVETNRHLAWAFETFGFATREGFLLALGAVVFVAMLAGIGVNAVSVWLRERFNSHASAHLSERLLRRYLRQPYEFFLTRNTSELGKNIFGEAAQVVTTVVSPCVHLLAHTTVAFAVLALLLVVEPVLALLVAAIVGGSYLAVFKLLRERLERIGAGRLQANRERFKAGGETFGGIKDIKLLGLEDLYAESFSRPAHRMARFAVAQRMIGHMPRFALEAVAFGGILVIVLYLLTAGRNLADALPLMGLYALAGYRTMPVLQQIFHNLADLRAGKPVLDNIHRELFGHTGARAPAPVSTAPRAHGHGRIRPARQIELREVTFQYPGSARPVLRDFNLRIPAGSTVGLVGPTGSGKTTVVDLLLCLLHPTEGAIVIDGEPLAGARSRDWQSNLGYVAQTIYLADRSVAANIAFGRREEEIDLERVRACAGAACLADFIEQELPESYATVVGERGVRLSGGQRQRVGIARALYRQPDVLVLDEATSALDTMTEQAVMRNIRSLGRDKTIVIVAHRLSTVSHCDTIFLLEHGTIGASGRFDDLLESNAVFRSLVTGRPDARPETAMAATR